MDTKCLNQLILYIVSRVEEFGGYTTTIRLVKFLYLIDLEHQRRFGHTLTGLEWIYHLYGPYAFEIPEVGARLGFDLQREEFISEEGHEGTLLHVTEPQDLPPGFNFGAEVLVNGLLQVWADEKTADLLQYVYRTEPMREARRGDRLDFSTVPSGTRYYELYVPVRESTAHQLRESVRSYVREDAGEFVHPVTVHDDVLAAGVRALDEDEKPLPKMVGIKPEVDVDALLNTLPNED